MDEVKLNILGLTQGSNIDIFIELINKIKGKKKINISTTSAYVSFARYFDSSRIVKKNQNIVYLLGMERMLWK